MKKALLPLMAAVLLLGSCGGNGATSTQTSTSSEEPFSSGVQVDWTQAQKAEFAKLYEGFTLPFYAMENIEVTYSDTAEYGKCVTIVGTVADEATAETEYAALMENAGYDLFESYFGGYAASKFDDVYNETYVLIYAEEGELCIDASYYVATTTAPTAELAAFASGTGSTATIPCPAASYYSLEVEEGEVFYLYCYAITETEASYKSTLEGAGYTVDGSYYDYYGYIADSEDGKLELIFYVEDGCFVLYGYPLED